MNEATARYELVKAILPAIIARYKPGKYDNIFETTIPIQVEHAIAYADRVLAVLNKP
jgi:hypothetical protein